VVNAVYTLAAPTQLELTMCLQSKVTS